MKTLRIIAAALLSSVLTITIACSSNNEMARTVKLYYANQDDINYPKMSRDIVRAMKYNIKNYDNCFLNGYGYADDSCKVWTLFSKNNVNYINIRDFKDGKSTGNYDIAYHGNIDWIKDIKDRKASNYIIRALAQLDGNTSVLFYRHPYDRSEIVRRTLPSYYRLNEINIDTISNDFVRQYAIALTRYVFPDK